MTWKNVKIRSELYDQLKALADKDHRSSAAQLELILGQPTMFPFNPQDPSPAFLEALKQAGEVGEGGNAASSPAAGGMDSRPPSSTSSRGRGATGSTLGCSPTDRGSSPRGPTPPKRERKSTCEHRIPLGSYCRVCDK